MSTELFFITIAEKRGRRHGAGGAGIQIPLDFGPRSGARRHRSLNPSPKSGDHEGTGGRFPPIFKLGDAVHFAPLPYSTQLIFPLYCIRIHRFNASLVT